MEKQVPRDCKIVNIRPGKDERCHTLFAELVDGRGVLLISGTLEYISRRLEDMNKADYSHKRL